MFNIVVDEGINGIHLYPWLYILDSLKCVQKSHLAAVSK